MKIAAITIFFNESFRIPTWLEFYEKCKEDIYLHIIVDNGSTDYEKEKLKKYFPDSKIIYRANNGGVTAAYNDGIKYALSDSEVDSILFFGNDIKLKENSLKVLHNFLFSNSKLGLVTPVLLRKDSNVIEENGDMINEYLVMEQLDSGKEYSNVIKDNICDCAPGAINLGKREFYEKISNLDEKLKMYSDEVDIGLQAKQKGYLISSCAAAVSWHQHTNYNNKKVRHPFSMFLSVRNKIYLARKYYNEKKAKTVYKFFIRLALKKFLIGLFKLKKEIIIESKFMYIGAKKGLKGDMGDNKYSSPN